MKNLSKLLLTGLLAIGLAACGNQNPNAQTGYYNQNGQWVPGVGGLVGGNACITSLNQGISLNFTASGIDDMQSRFFAGAIPQYWTAAGTHGQVSLSGGGYQQGYGAVSLQKTSSNGTINMTLNPQARTATGSIQISSAALMDPRVGLSYSMYSGGQYGQTSNICVTSIALDVTYSSSGSYYGQMSTGQIYGAMVFLYLSNGQVLQSPIAI